MNPHRSQSEAFVTLSVESSALDNDILIVGLEDRNRAIHDDEVRTDLGKVTRGWQKKERKGGN